MVKSHNATRDWGVEQIEGLSVPSLDYQPPTSPKKMGERASTIHLHNCYCCYYYLYHYHFVLMLFPVLLPGGCDVDDLTVTLPVNVLADGRDDGAVPLLMVPGFVLRGADADLV